MKSAPALIALLLINSCSYEPDAHVASNLTSSTSDSSTDSSAALENSKITVDASILSPQISQITNPGPIKIEYSNAQGDRYLIATLIKSGKTIRTLYSDAELGEAFEEETPSRLSPDRAFVYLTQIVSTTLETESGTSKREVAYCSILKTDNGCIVARETGEFCGGNFTDNGTWENSLYSNYNLNSASPLASDYAEGKRTPQNSPETSLDNLLACDPPSKNKKKQYKNIFEKKYFSLEQA